jgi:hypothetical protein
MQAELCGKQLGLKILPTMSGGFMGAELQIDTEKNLSPFL